MNQSVKALILSAAVTGLLSGTTARVQAQTTPAQTNARTTVTQNTQAGVRLIGFQTPDTTKHSCKGKNDCKGQGGCKSSDNGCKAKNSCKGKGGCATDGSKMPTGCITRRFHPKSREARLFGWIHFPLPVRALLEYANRNQIMPANRFNGFTDYGVGIGLRIPHYRHIFAEKPVVDWFEIISENYMVDGGRPLHVLDQILDQYRVVQHGVSMYFGSAQPLNREHLKNLKTLVKRTGTPWLTDHLCWGSVDGRYTHDLLPIPYTLEAVKTTAERIRQVQDFVEIPVAVENVSSYAEFTDSTMTEWEFLNEVVEAADCGILLDVNNIYVSSQNHAFDPMTYVNSVPAERVAQIHIAGHSRYEKYILDTHDHPVIDPVWRLYERAIDRCGPTATLLEWDDNIPTFDEVHAEALKANRYLQPAKHRSASGLAVPAVSGTAQVRQ